MKKQRLTKKQQAAKRRAEQEEKSKITKLLAQRTPAKQVSINKIPSYGYEDTANIKAIPSAGPAKKRNDRVQKIDDPVMIEREAAAQKELAKKRKRIAPAYSKGPYMFITDDTDPKELGRKL